MPKTLKKEHKIRFFNKKTVDKSKKIINFARKFQKGTNQNLCQKPRFYSSTQK